MFCNESHHRPTVGKRSRWAKRKSHHDVCPSRHTRHKEHDDMGSIAKCPPNKDGSVSWKAEARDGTGKRKTKRHRTRALAKAWVKETETHMATTRGLKAGVLLRDAVIRYRDEEAPKRRGVKWETNRCNAFLREPMADVPLATLSLEDAEEHMDARLSLGLANDTVIREMTLMKVVVRNCRRWYGLKSYPWTGLRMPKAGAARDRLITETEVAQIVVASQYSPTYTPIMTTQRVGAMFLLAIETGMRQGEIAGITPNMLDLEGQLVHLPGWLTKTEKPRDIPLSPDALSLITNMPDCAPDAPVFGMSAESASSLFIRIRRKAGLPEPKEGGFRFHDTRHLACTRLAAMPGIDVLDLARIIGHTNISQLNTYFNESATAQVGKLNRQHDLRKTGQMEKAETLRAMGVSEAEIQRLTFVDTARTT